MSLVPRVVYHDDVLLLASFRDIFIQCWNGPGTAAHMRRMIDAHRAFASDHGPQASVALSHVTVHGVKRPDDETRALMAEHSRAVRGLRASATIIDAHGFGAALVRGIVSGLLLLSERDTAHDVFATPREGFAFLLGRRSLSAAPIELDELDAAYARVRASQRID